MWNKLTHIGLKSTYTSEELQKRVIFNKINIIVFFLFVIIIISDLINISVKEIDFSVDLFGSYFIVLFCITHLLLNKCYLFNIAKTLMFFDIPLVLLFFAPITSAPILSSYFWGPYAPIVFSVVPYYLFNEKHETKWLYLSLAYFSILLLGYDVYLLSLKTTDSYIIEIIKENYLFYKLIPIVAFVFVNLSMLHAFRLNRKFLYELNKSNKKLEKQNIDLAKLNDTKGKFLRIIGHDLKSPISSVVQFCELIELQKEKIDKVEFFDIVSAIKVSGNKSYKLLTDLLIWAQSQSGDINFSPKQLNLFNLVDESEKLLISNFRAKNIQFNNNVRNDLEIWADDKMLHTILRNLISNAIKFTPEFGEINIDAVKNQSQVHISVTDNGIGIKPEDLKNLFRIDVNTVRKGTNKEEGTGLGLLICKEFINSHKGEIWVDSEVNKGSKFTFSLPCKKNATTNQ